MPCGSLASPGSGLPSQLHWRRRPLKRSASPPAIPAALYPEPGGAEPETAQVHLDRGAPPRLRECRQPPRRGPGRPEAHLGAHERPGAAIRGGAPPGRPPARWAPPAAWRLRLWRRWRRWRHTRPPVLAVGACWGHRPRAVSDALRVDPDPPPKPRRPAPTPQRGRPEPCFGGGGSSRVPAQSHQPLFPHLRRASRARTFPLTFKSIAPTSGESMCAEAPRAQCTHSLPLPFPASCSPAEISRPLSTDPARAAPAASRASRSSSSSRPWPPPPPSSWGGGPLRIRTCRGTVRSAGQAACPSLCCGGCGGWGQGGAPRPGGLEPLASVRR